MKEKNPISRFECLRERSSTISSLTVCFLAIYTISSLTVSLRLEHRCPLYPASDKSTIGPSTQALLKILDDLCK